jgi:hypothetical protein
VAIGAWLVACGGESAPRSSNGPPDEPIEPISGSRLKVRAWRQGSASMPATIYDTELDVECSFQLASDGVERCLPTRAGLVQFGDTECRQAIALAAVGCDGAPSRFAELAGEAELCSVHGAPRSIYRLGDPVALPSEIFEAGPPGCQAARETAREYFAATLVEPETFARGDRIVVPRTSELGTELIVTDDGLSLPVAVHDLSRKQECELLRVGADGPLDFHCMNNLASSHAFAPNCAGGLAVSHRPLACGNPEVAVELTFSECAPEPIYELFELGSSEPELTISPVGLGVCEPDEGPATFPAFEIGAARSAQGFAAVNLDPVGGDRLERLVYSSAGTTLLAEAFWDASFEARCEPRTFADGSTYCIPSTLRTEYDSGRYANDDCSVPLLVRTLNACDSEVTPVLARRQAAGDDSCGVSVASFHRLERFEGEGPYRIQSDGTCTREESDPAESYYLLGDEVFAKDAFVELTLE